MGNPFTVHLISWHDGEPLLRAIREKVFMQEQNVPVELEWDGLDDVCHHALALSANGDAIGCGRITPYGHIGRMAVLPGWRRKHIGSAILELLVDYARSQNYGQVELNAQVQAIPLYKTFGFEVEGDEFMDANIPHRKMTLQLKHRGAA
ncbi:MAG TPA: GNAT family N-acetyltransferase [Gallionellaceae bacterium]|nr:GNAT family N-acetyltransferase [Gallionellaceae bacterium]